MPRDLCQAVSKTSGRGTKFAGHYVRFVLQGHALEVAVANVLST